MKIQLSASVRLWWICIAILMVFFIISNDFIRYSLFLYYLASHNDYSLKVNQYYLISYYLTFSMSIFISMNIMTHIGPRRLVFFGLIIYFIALALSLISNNIFILISSRSLQGIGSAFLILSSIKLLKIVFPENKYKMIFHLLLSTILISIILAPFLTLYPIAKPYMVLMIIAFFMLLISTKREPWEANKNKMNWLSIALLVLTVLCLFFALSNIDLWHISLNFWSIIIFIGMVFFVLLIIYENQQLVPLIQPEIFDYSSFVLSSITLFLVLFCIGANFYCICLYLHTHYFLSMWQMAFITFAYSFSFALCCLISCFFNIKLPTLLFTMLVLLIINGLFFYFITQLSLLYIIILFSLVGITFGLLFFNFPRLNTLVLPENYRFSAWAFMLMIGAIALSVSVAIANSIILNSNQRVFQLIKNISFPIDKYFPFWLNHAVEQYPLVNYSLPHSVIMILHKQFVNGLNQIFLLNIIILLLALMITRYMIQSQIQ